MIHCRIITPEGIYKEFDTPILNIQTEEEDRGILENHMPLVTILRIGHLESEENGERKTYAISGGVFYFRDNQAEILTESIESKEEIDVERAQAAKERAERRLGSDNPNVDQQRAEIALKKALNRLKIKGTLN